MLPKGANPIALSHPGGRRFDSGSSIAAIGDVPSHRTGGRQSSAASAIDQGRSLGEVHLDSKADAIELQLKAEDYRIDFNEHHLRHEGNGGVTVTVFGSAEELDALQAAGYSVGRTIEGPGTWRDRTVDWQADMKAEQRADAAALAEGSAEVAPRGDIIVLRVDYFENYAGRFLSVEAKDGTRGSATTGASLALSWTFS